MTLFLMFASLQSSSVISPVSSHVVQYVVAPSFSCFGIYFKSQELSYLLIVSRLLKVRISPSQKKVMLFTLLKAL